MFDTMSNMRSKQQVQGRVAAAGQCFPGFGSEGGWRFLRQAHDNHKKALLPKAGPPLRPWVGRVNTQRPDLGNRTQ